MHQMLYGTTHPDRLGGARRVRHGDNFAVDSGMVRCIVCPRLLKPILYCIHCLFSLAGKRCGQRDSLFDMELEDDDLSGRLSFLECEG